MQAARRRGILILTSVGRRAESGPRRVLPRVRRPAVCRLHILAAVGRRKTQATDATEPRPEEFRVGATRINRNGANGSRRLNGHPGNRMRIRFS